MAYCRMSGNSDVYMFGYGEGFQFYLSESFTGKPKDFRVTTRKEALHRLERLRTQGYKVPDHPFERLRQEIEEGYV